VNTSIPLVLVLTANVSPLAVNQYNMSTLETIFSGAAPLGAALTRQVMDRLTVKRKGKSPVNILQGLLPVNFIEFCSLIILQVMGSLKLRQPPI
jgi:hypothetical protein